MDETQPLMEIQSGQMANPLYSVLVYPYAFGQFRIQLTRADQPEAGAPPGHGAIVRQMCTYDRSKAVIHVAELASSLEPEALAESWAQPWNCEYPRGRIRLDNEPEAQP